MLKITKVTQVCKLISIFMVDKEKRSVGYLPVQVFSKKLLDSNRVLPLFFCSLGVPRNLFILLVELQVQPNICPLLPTGT